MYIIAYIAVRTRKVGVLTAFVENMNFTDHMDPKTLCQGGKIFFKIRMKQKRGARVLRQIK